MPLPATLMLNAFTGKRDPGSALHPQAKKWIAGGIEAAAQVLAGRRGPEPEAWADPLVGWGVVLPDIPGRDFARLATAEDAPAAIQRLLEYRKGAVLRWSPDLPLGKLRRYYPDGGAQEPDLVLSDRGTARGRIPQYLLLCASPDVIPWRVQYRLNGVAFTGRLDLKGAALDHYVDAVVAGFAGAPTQPDRSVVWAVDHGGADITHLMRRVVARKVVQALAADPSLKDGTLFIDGGAGEAATGPALIEALKVQQPSLVLTTSHGMTGPLGDVPTMTAQLGVPVDGSEMLLDVDRLLEQWSPHGAVWYAHACCSAGSDNTTSYAGLVAPGSYAEQVLQGVTLCGARVAPLPQKLLGAERPLRAFVGHVEPTFDWSLRENLTGQVLTGSLVDALYGGLFDGLPVGYAFQPVHEKAPRLDALHREAKEAYNRGEDRLDEALTCRLVAQDLASLVILGDPAEALAPVPGPVE